MPKDLGAWPPLETIVWQLAEREDQDLPIPDQGPDTQKSLKLRARWRPSLSCADFSYGQPRAPYLGLGFVCTNVFSGALSLPSSLTDGSRVRSSAVSLGIRLPFPPDVSRPQRSPREVSVRSCERLPENHCSFIPLYLEAYCSYILPPPSSPAHTSSHLKRAIFPPRVLI